MAVTSGLGWAQEATGELVILQRQTGVDGELWQKLGTAFVAENPGVTIRELAITAQGDARGGMRTALTAAGVETPFAIPGKYWAHAEWFKTLLARTAGVEDMARLGGGSAKWTHPEVKTARMAYAQMIQAGCCGDAATMLANDWDGAAGNMRKAESRACLLMGIWVDATARGDDKLEEGKDDSFFQMPALRMGHEDTSVVDAKEPLGTSNGTNPAAADAVLVVTTTKTAADILAEYGYAAPSTEADPARLDRVRQVATAAATEVRCVPGGPLPDDLVDAASRCRHSCKTQRGYGKCDHGRAGYQGRDGLLRRPTPLPPTRRTRPGPDPRAPSRGAWGREARPFFSLPPSWRSLPFPSSFRWSRRCACRVMTSRAWLRPHGWALAMTRRCSPTPPSAPRRPSG